MFQQVIAEIEAGSVFFDMTISNTPKAALRRLKASPLLREAREEMVLDPKNVYLYLDKARKAFSIQVSAGYMSPEDGALAAYVFLLARVPEINAQKFIDEVASSGRMDLRKAVWVSRYYAERVPSLTMRQSAAPFVGDFTSMSVASDGVSNFKNTVFSLCDAGLSRDITIRQGSNSWQRLNPHCRTLICV